jgi:hypothetical protein
MSNNSLIAPWRIGAIFRVQGSAAVAHDTVAKQVDKDGGGKRLAAGETKEGDVLGLPSSKSWKSELRSPVTGRPCASSASAFVAFSLPGCAALEPKAPAARAHLISGSYIVAHFSPARVKPASVYEDLQTSISLPPTTMSYWPHRRQEGNHADET